MSQQRHNLSLKSIHNPLHETNIERCERGNLFQIKMVNNLTKRRLMDPDETPLKKPFSLRALSPDQGFVELTRTSGTEDSHSASCSPALFNVKSVSGNTDESRTHQLCFNNDINGILSHSPVGAAVHKEEGKDEGYFSLSYVKGPVLESSIDEVIEGGYEHWDIGPPLLESSTCVPDEVEPEHSFRDDTQDTSYKPSLLQVQVKSVVVVVGSKNPSENPRVEQSRASESRKRPKVSREEVDWERGKGLYVHSVRRHIDEKPERDVVSELHSLMSHVADEMQSSSDRRWQHPADLTCRNYQQRFGNTSPKLLLHEWVAKSFEDHKRFAKVPKFFKRSQFT